MIFPSSNLPILVFFMLMAVAVDSKVTASAAVVSSSNLRGKNERVDNVEYDLIDEIRDRRLRRTNRRNLKKNKKKKKNKGSEPQQTTTPAGTSAGAASTPPATGTESSTTTPPAMTTAGSTTNSGESTAVTLPYSNKGTAASAQRPGAYSGAYSHPALSSSGIWKVQSITTVTDPAQAGRNPDDASSTTSPPSPPELEPEPEPAMEAEPAQPSPGGNIYTETSGGYSGTYTSPALESFGSWNVQIIDPEQAGRNPEGAASPPPPASVDVDIMSCEGGGTDGQNMNFFGINFGQCSNCDPCLAALMPSRMAFYCPLQFRPYCDGTCQDIATACAGGKVRDASNNEWDIYDERWWKAETSAWGGGWPANFGPSCTRSDVASF
eukprot:CAMPEP_0178649404 /NCGR_PEP_ID=MMETSP0698-20121128/21003_1 /TAXON_ID=265572 /ORGANISM="Extubocellulus spinifer, Strain CCMP396" /LENGTH=379 /DNA_ID=CAMNT_0020290851 /DNA_START=93 /DNA_END=1232 /DNA_ORIENTATION=-